MKTLFFTIPALFALMFTCAEDIDPTSEYDSDFVGTYRIGYEIAPLPDDDTLELFRDYGITFSNTGKYDLRRFTLSTAPAGNVREFEAEVTDSVYPLYFTAPFSGELIITGVRPNEKTVDSSIAVTVVNPYVIVVDSGTLRVSDRVSFYCVNDRTGKRLESPCYFKIKRSDAEKFSTIAADSCFTLDVARPDSFTLLASVGDGKGNSVACENLAVYVPLGKTIPEVSIDETSLVAPVGHPFTLVATVKNTDSLVWHVAGSDVDTTSTDASLTITWDETGNDTVIVRAKDRFGTLGKSDTVFFEIREKSLELALVTFPTIARVREKTVWEVAAKKDGKPLSGSKVTYVWNVSPESAVKTQKVNNEKMSVQPVDSAKSFTVTVFAVSEGDSTAERSVSVQVLADNPVVELLPYRSTVNKGDTVTFTLRLFAGSDDAPVEHVYCRTEADNEPIAVADSTISLVFDTPGKREIAFWCVDAEGFVSEVIVAPLTITSDKPWFFLHTFDTTVFINDDFTITAAASPGEGEYTITEWHWDTDDDGTPDRTTTVDHIDTVFTEAGTVTITVTCVDNHDHVSEVSMTITVTVVAGNAPVVTAITPTEAWINDTVGYILSAHDADGEVVAYDLRWEEDGAWQTITDSVVDLHYASAGTKTVRIVARDNHGNASDTFTTNLTVKAGRPQVHGDSLPSAVGVHDEYSYTVLGSDENGTIKKYYVAFGDEAFGSGNSDGKYLHTFDDTGSVVIRCFVEDDDGIRSDTLEHTVQVIVGLPAFTAITLSPDADALFLNDVMHCRVTATDANGSVESLFVWIDDDGSSTPAYTRKVNNDTASLTHAFPVAGAHTLLFRIKDNSGVERDTGFTVTVKKPAYTLTTSCTPGTGGSITRSKDSTHYLLGDGVTLIATPKTGYRFDGWSGDTTASDSSLTVTIRKNRTMVANFVRQFTVTYDKNGASTGTVPSPTLHDSGSTVTVAGTTGSLEKEGYDFEGWNTKANGSGVDYAAGTGSFTITADKTLYAKWVIKELTVTYDKNGGDGTAPTTIKTYTIGQTVTVLANPGKLVKGAKSFAGWNTSPTGSGTTYACGATFTIGGDDVTLYANYSTTSVMDNDGNLYAVVQIGNQVWMAENLKTTKYDDGNDIPYVSDTTMWKDRTVPGYGFYDMDKYGAVYNQKTVQTNRLAPAGWHVPSFDEFSEMDTYLNNKASSLADSTWRTERSLRSVTGWVDNKGTNKSKFNALPGGVFGYHHHGIDSSTNFWTTTHYFNGEEYHEVLISANSDIIFMMPTGMRAPKHIRCIKD